MSANISDGQAAISSARPPAMTDVAARAGVSHQTVSRVLNDHPSVRPATRDRVLAAIEELGYRRSSAARALATGNTSTVGVLMSNGGDFGPSNTVIAVAAAARENGYFVSMASLARYDVEVTRQGIDHLVDQGVEGIVVVAPHEEIARAVDEYTTACPVVVVAARPEIPDDSAARYVCINQGSGAAQATDHLIDLGHTRIWHIAGPEGWFDSSSRRASYVACMERAGLAPVILTAAGWTPSCGYLLGEQVAASVRSGGGPTALFVASDALAIGLFRAVWEAGLRVPDDVSVVGFDDIEAAEYLVPRLTTVHQPFAKVGREALRVLIEQLGRRGGGLPPLASVLEPELIVRDSAVRRV